MSRKPRKPQSRDEIYAALVESRGLRSAFDLALATEITDALVAGNLAEVVRALALLPPVIVRADRSGRIVSAEQARAKLTTLVMNAVAADQIETGRAEQTELDAARARIASLEDECAHLRGSKPRRLPAPSAKPMKSAAAAPKPAPAVAAPPSLPPSAPPPTGPNWDASENGRRWANHYYGGGGDRGETLGAFFSRINGREY
jgi:hypothetical protein